MIEEIFHFAVIIGLWLFFTRIVLPKFGVPT